MDKRCQEVDFKLVRSKRKTIALYVRRGGEIEVRAPNHVSLTFIKQFVEKKGQWIARQRATLTNLPEFHEPCYYEGATHYFMGELRQISLGAICTGLASITLQVKDSNKDAIYRSLQRWYRKQAEIVFNDRHKYWRLRLNHFSFQESAVVLRKMKRRWGSCSSSGVITLNTQLIKYPVTCIDAVIVHELCHLLEFNHSKRFYRLMDEAFPDWQKADKLLRKLSLCY